MHKKLMMAVIVAMVLAGCQPPQTDTPVQPEVQESAVEELETQKDFGEIVDKSFVIKEDTNGVNADELDQYNIEAILDTELKTLECKQTVLYKNKEDVALDKVIFQVLPNAYESLETAPVLFGDVESIYPNGFEPGYIEFTEVKINDKVAEYTIYGDDNTLMNLALEEALNPNENVEISMTYTVQIPPAYDRFGYNGSTFNIANWYPVAAVYDEKGWHEDSYLAVGDPFYTDMAVYEMTYNVPNDYEVASTGVRTEKDESVEGRSIIKYSADLVRDSAWLASDSWNIYVDEVDGTTIRSYYFGEFNYPEEKAVEVARDSLIAFEYLFGEYPYSELAIVATDFPSGMEYPSLVMIAKDRYKSSRIEALEGVIAHEIGHQWWYGVVGNNQIEEAWLDESLTVFATAMYYGEKYGEDAYDNYVGRYAGTYSARKGGDGDGIVVKDLTQFESWSDYSNLIYRKGFLFIDALVEEYGKEDVIEFLQAYYQQKQFKTATTNDLVELGESFFGKKFIDMADEWLYNDTDYLK